MLDQFSQHADYAKYLTFILCRSKEQSESVRVLAGIVLKNRLRSAFVTFDLPSLGYVMHEALGALADSIQLVRGTAGSVVTNVIIKTGFRQWPDLLPTLLQFLGSDNPLLIEVWTGQWDGHTRVGTRVGTHERRVRGSATADPTVDPRP